jgi:hypothetical protein
LLAWQFAFAQQTKMSDYALFGGRPAGTCIGCSTAPSPGNGVVLAAGTTILGNGKVGSYTLFNTTGTGVVVNGSIVSGGKVQTANSFTLNGNLSAAGTLSGTIVSMGTSTILQSAGNIDANGPINIGKTGSLVAGKVSKPADATYVGPTPTLDSEPAQVSQGYLPCRGSPAFPPPARRI